MKFFFYGTLKTGQFRNSVLDGQTFLGKTTTKPNYRLLRISSFPGMVKAEEDGVAVQGEVWEVDEECVRVLDRIEGHPDLFKREPVELANGMDDVLSYFWQGGTIRFESIGDCW